MYIKPLSSSVHSDNRIINNRLFFRRKQKQRRYLFDDCLFLSTNLFRYEPSHFNESLQIYEHNTSLTRLPNILWDCLPQDILTAMEAHCARKLMFCSQYKSVDWFNQIFIPGWMRFLSNVDLAVETIPVFDSLPQNITHICGKISGNRFNNKNNNSICVWELF